MAHGLKENLRICRCGIVCFCDFSALRFREVTEHNLRCTKALPKPVIIKVDTHLDERCTLGNCNPPPTQNIIL